MRGNIKNKFLDSEEAIEDYTKAIELDYNFAEAYCNRGIAKRDVQDYIGAIKDLEKYLSLKPDDKEIKNILATYGLTNLAQRLPN